MFENLKPSNDLRPSDPRFGCGPSLIPTSFVKSLSETGQTLLGTSHRRPGVKNLIKEIQKGLSHYFEIPTSHKVVIGNGGATLFFDMVALGLVEKKATHFTCGEFSNKWFKSSKAVPWIEAEEVSVDFGNGIDGEDRTDSDLIAVTLNETSTGVMLSSLPEVDEKTLLAMDATSGAGQIPCDISKVDVFFFSPQKVFASEGGLFIAIMSPKALARAERIEATDRYIPPIMSFKTAIDNSEKGQTYNTPSISTLYFLNEQIKLMNSEGRSSVEGGAIKKAELLYGWAQSKSYLSPYIEELKYRSLSVATIDLEDKYPASDLTKKLSELGIANGIDSYRKLGRNQFRISMFHNISYDDLKKLTEIISEAIESCS